MHIPSVGLKETPNVGLQETPSVGLKETPNVGLKETPNVGGMSVGRHNTFARSAAAGRTGPA